MNLIRPVLQSSIFHKNIYNIRYSRQFLKSLDVDQKQVKQQKLQQQTQTKKQHFLNLSTNDRNQANHVKVRMNHPLFNVSYYPPDQKVKTCSILQPQQKFKQKKLVSAERKYIITSIKKTKQALYPIKKLYIIDAISTLMGSHKKVAKVMIRTFWNLMDHAKQKGMQPMRLWVHGCLIGKTKRYFNVRYHAKGRGAKQKRDFCRVKIVCYQKQEDEFYQQLAEGKCPAGLANNIRRVLLQREDTNYQSLSRYLYLTTAKGRQQASQLIKRKVDVEMAKNLKEGVFVPKKVVRQNILKEEGEKTRQDLKDLHSIYSSQVQLLKREQLFKKNMGIAD